MHVRKLLSWGVVIYAVLNLVWTILVANGLSDNIVSRVIMIAVLIGLSVIATRSLNLFTERDAVPYAVGWVLIAACLDALGSVSLIGWTYLSNANVWVGYGLLLAVPLIVAAVSKRSIS